MHPTDILYHTLELFVVKLGYFCKLVTRQRFSDTFLRCLNSVTHESHFVDKIFKRIFLNESHYTLIQISLVFFN